MNYFPGIGLRSLYCPNCERAFSVVEEDDATCPTCGWVPGQKPDPVYQKANDENLRTD